MRVLAAAPDIVMSAATLAECQVVALGKSVSDRVDAILARAQPQIVEIGTSQVRAMLAAYARWGKGIHPARLNIFDCFAYALANERNLPLLYVGDDFAKTDVRAALAVLDPEHP